MFPHAGQRASTRRQSSGRPGRCQSTRDCLTSMAALSPWPLQVTGAGPDLAGVVPWIAPAGPGSCPAACCQSIETGAAQPFAETTHTAFSSSHASFRCHRASSVSGSIVDPRTRGEEKRPRFPDRSMTHRRLSLAAIAETLDHGVDRRSGANLNQKTTEEEQLPDWSGASRQIAPACPSEMVRCARRVSRGRRHSGLQ